jgi:hypothetical protein
MDSPATQTARRDARRILCPRKIGYNLEEAEALNALISRENAETKASAFSI